MRKVFDPQYSIGSVPIKDIQIDLKCRDDICLYLYALQQMYKQEEVRACLFARLAEVFPRGVRTDRGRPGMSAWQIFV